MFERTVKSVSLPHSTAKLRRICEKCQTDSTLVYYKAKLTASASASLKLHLNCTMTPVTTTYIRQKQALVSKHFQSKQQDADGIACYVSPGWLNL